MSNLSPNKQLLIGLIDSSKTYQFPDSDFCRFIHLPRSGQVFVYIQTKPRLNCTCTLLWLMQNWTESDSSQLIQSSESLAHCLNDPEKFKDMIRMCEFETRRLRCLDIKESKQKIERVNIAVVLTIVGVGVLILGLFVIGVWVVSNKKQKSENRNTQLTKKVHFWVC